MKLEMGDKYVPPNKGNEGIAGREQAAWEELEFGPKKTATLQT